MDASPERESEREKQKELRFYCLSRGASSSKLTHLATLECSEARAEAKELFLRESRAVVTCGTFFRTTTAPYLFVCSLARLVSVLTLPPQPINICALETEYILS
jgi:hypothetical protein